MTADIGGGRPGVRRLRKTISTLLLRPQRPDLLARLPHFAVRNLLQLLFELLPVVGPAVRFQRAPSLIAGLDRLVELLKDGPRSVAKLLEPVERAALGRRRAIGVHPVHPLLGDQGVQALGRFLDSLIKRLLRAMPVGP